MGIRSALIDTDGSALSTRKVFGKSNQSLTGDEIVLLDTDIIRVYSTFKNVSRTTAGTTNVTTPEEAGSLLITDVVLNTEKQTGGVVEVQFTDDTNTINIFKGYCTDFPVNVILPTNGRFQGWKDARIDLVVTNNTDCSLTLGYIKLPHGLAFEEWDALR